MAIQLHSIAEEVPCPEARRSLLGDGSLDEYDVIAASSHRSDFLFVGVMTAKKYIATRARAINGTWASTVPGSLQFFVPEKTDTVDNIPVVRLPGVDDTYPPQKKSFLMLKYMYDNYLNDYEWFLRADDDLFVRTDRLEMLLRSLDPSVPHFIGQAGLGTPEEYGLLNLGTWFFG